MFVLDSLIDGFIILNFHTHYGSSLFRLDGVQVCVCQVAVSPRPSGARASSFYIYEVLGTSSTMVLHTFGTM